MTRARQVSRHRSREAALQVLFALDVAQQRGDAASPEAVFDAVAANFEMPEGARAFAKELVVQAQARRAELDETVAAHARNWRLSRMGIVDRNILRLATWELAHTDTPAAVVLDEAIELARRFGGDASPGFVNGVLDAVARTLREAAP